MSKGNITYWDNLPQELQINILGRLPLDTLKSCLLVNKSVSSLVTSPIFMTATTSRNTNSHVYCARAFNGTKTYFVCSDTRTRFERGNKIISNFRDDSNYFLVGSSHGLVCFSSYFHPYYLNLLLWNPFLGKSSRVISYPIGADGESYTLTFGFGFDRSCMDFKVVRIRTGFPQDHTRITADVYSIFSGTSTTVYGSVSHPISHIMGQGSFTDGALHWGAIFYCNHSNRELGYTVLSFDIAKMEFKEIGIPTGIADKLTTLTTLTIEGHEKLTVYKYDIKCQECSVWVMEAYGVAESWTKFCTIDCDSMVGEVKFIKILNVLDNGEIVLSISNGNLICYHPKNNSNDIAYYGRRNDIVDYLGPFVKNLVFIDKNMSGSMKRTREIN